MSSVSWWTHSTLSTSGRSPSKKKTKVYFIRQEAATSNPARASRQRRGIHWLARDLISREAGGLSSLSNGVKHRICGDCIVSLDT
jgi:hypothetical protein